MSIRVLAAVALLSVIHSGLASDAMRYKLKEDAAPFGAQSAGRTGGSAEGTIPFEKSFDQLTGDQQRQIKSAYIEMGDADEPPYPIGGLKTIFKPIMAGQQRLQVEGMFKANVEVDSNGDPTAIAILKSPSKEATDFVARIVMVTKFKPAVCAGRPCNMGFPLLIGFKTQ
jgi:hypothetical protein